jgi:hypothetical protein
MKWFDKEGPTCRLQLVSGVYNPFTCLATLENVKCFTGQYNVCTIIPFFVVVKSTMSTALLFKSWPLIVATHVLQQCKGNYFTNYNTNGSFGHSCWKLVFLIVSELRESWAVCNGGGTKFLVFCGGVYVCNGYANYNNYWINYSVRLVCITYH